MKKLITLSISVFFIFLTFSGLSKAETLFSPPLEIDFADSGGASLVCIITNVSQTTRQMTVDIIDIDGDTISSVSDMVAPGARLGATQGSDNGNATPSHCRFNIVNGKKESVRASACIFQEGTGCISALQAE